MGLAHRIRRKENRPRENVEKGKVDFSDGIEKTLKER
jgi:hypothetical protein